MTDTPPLHVEERGPTEMRDPLIREEIKRASVWIGLALLIVGIAFLAQPILLIIGGLVFAAILDGGTRLLGRILPIPRGWRLLIVSLAFFAFLIGTVWLTGSQMAQQAETFREVTTQQIDRALQWVGSFGVVPADIEISQILQQLMGSIGRLTYAVTSLLGALTSFVMIVVIGLFIAAEPHIYERGIAWMLPLRMRDPFYRTAERMGFTLRRLMLGRLIGMAVEGVGTWLLLWAGGVPMAALLGLLTGILAFLPNIGAIVSGVLIVMVGFSVSMETGLWAIAVYLIVQTVDGYLIVPYVARKTVDLAPAMVLGAQLLFGALFGVLGLALADPIVAMTKAALQQKSLEESGQAAGVVEP